MLKNLITAQEHIQADVRQVLAKFAEGYKKRDLENIDTYMRELFVESDECIILGTSTGELCLGFQQSKTLVENDWKYWGDVTYDVENALISAEGDVAWFATQANFLLKIKPDAERCQKYVEFVQEELETGKGNLHATIASLNWAYALTFHQRPEGERHYQCPLTLSGVLVKDEGRWKFQYMQFSLVFNNNFYDERFEFAPTFRELYAKQLEKIKAAQTGSNDSGLRELMHSLETGWNEHQLGQFFSTSTDEKCYLIDMVGSQHLGRAEMSQAMESHRHRYGKLKLEIDLALISRKGDVAWVVTSGLLINSRPTDELLQERSIELKTLVESEMSAEKKVFQLKRKMAEILMEAAAGEESTIPIRFEGIAVTEADGWKFRQLRISFPYYWIFEQKIDAVSDMIII